MSIVGASAHGAASARCKTLLLVNSLVGMSVTSLTLSYLMQVYTAPCNRNTVGLALEAQSAETAT